MFRPIPLLSVYSPLFSFLIATIFGIFVKNEMQILEYSEYESISDVSRFQAA